MQKFFKKYGYLILLGLIIFIGFFLRLKGLLINPDLWHDECALGWNIKFKNYGDFFGVLRFMQMAPPFFMVLTKITTKIFGFSEVSLRLLPFLAGCGSIIAFYFLAEKTMKDKAAVLLAVFFFAINQQLINYSFEFKPYSFDVFFAVTLLLFFINLDFEKLNAKKALLYGSLLAIVPWFSFTSIFIIAGGVINLLFKNLKNKNGLFTICYLLFALLISGLIYIKLYMINNYTGTNMVNYWQDSFLNFNPLFFMSLLIDNIRYFFFPMPFVLFGLILLLWGARIFYKEKSAFFNIFALSFLLLVLASLLHIYPFSDRLILFLLPMFLLCMMKPLDIALEVRKIKLFIVLLLMFFAFYPQLSEVNKFIHSKGFSRGEYPREMMDFIMKNIKKDDVIFIDKNSNTEFAYYSSFYNIKNKIIQEPQKVDDKEFLNSLEKKKYYWFYLAFQPSNNILDWIRKNTKTSKFIDYSFPHGYLFYIYVE